MGNKDGLNSTDDVPVKEPQTPDTPPAPAPENE